MNGSEVYGLGAAEAAELRRAIAAEDPEEVLRVLRTFSLESLPLIDDTPVVSPPLRALSLAVAQTCNLGCTYCYAQQGHFGWSTSPSWAENRSQTERS